MEINRNTQLRFISKQSQTNRNAKDRQRVWNVAKLYFVKMWKIITDLHKT